MLRALDMRVDDDPGRGRVAGQPRAHVAHACAEREVGVVGRAVARGRARAVDEVLRDQRAVDGRVGAARDAQAILAEQRAGGEQADGVAVARAGVVDALGAADDLAGGDDAPVDRAGRGERRGVVLRAVDQDADPVVLVDARAVDPELPGAVNGRQQRGGGLDDADAGLRTAPAAGREVGVVALGRDDVGDVAADHGALGVEEEDARLDGDGATGRVITVDRDAGDVDLQGLGRCADDRDDVADAVAQVRRGLEDAAAVDGRRLRADADQVSARALERQRLADRHRIGARMPRSPRRSRPCR